MGQFTRNGVPDALLRDGWWLSAPVEAQRGTAVKSTTVAIGWLTAAIVLLADITFWHGAGSLPLTVFTGVFTGLMIWVFKPSEWRKLLMFAGLSILPVLAFWQTLSVIFWIIGLAGITVVAAGNPLRAMGHIWLRLPWMGPKQAVPRLIATRNHAKGSMRHWVQSWGLAVGVGLVFAVLFLLANPVLDDLAYNIANSFDMSDDVILRVLLWLFAAWFAISVGAAKDVTVSGRKAMPVLFTAVAVRNALLVFNVMFAVQLVSDSTVVLGLVDLPANMTLADFAHRGAYPLVATALLAGVFMLLARPHRSFPNVTLLLAVWVGLNVLLVASAALRLNVYIADFGWTYLRVYAAIWMVLVVLGLCFVAYDIWRRQADGWVVKWSVRSALITLFIACFINIGSFIATKNIERYETGLRMDWQYLCHMDVSASAVMKSWYVDKCHGRYYYSPTVRIDSWRGWDFRRWTIKRSINKQQQVSPL
ncbi:MAG: DUF4173 domain-containing protein [Planktomarina sp.]